MKKILSKLADIEAMLTEDNQANFKAMTKSEKKIVGYLEVVKSDYIAFIFGFFSAIVVEEFLGIFRKRVLENVWDFSLTICNLLLMGIACFFFLRLSAAFSELQSAFDAKKTRAAGYNALLTRFEETRKSIGSILRDLKRILLSSLLALALNIAYFIFINIS